MPDDSSRNIIVLVLVGILAVALADFGVWSWLRRQIQRLLQRVGVDLPTWVRRRLYIAPAALLAQATTSTDTQEDAPSADQIYLVTTERLLNSQVATNDILDTKTSGAVSVGSTILPLTFGLLSLSDNPLPQAGRAALDCRGRGICDPFGYRGAGLGHSSN